MLYPLSYEGGTSTRSSALKSTLIVRHQREVPLRYTLRSKSTMIL